MIYVRVWAILSVMVVGILLLVTLLTNMTRDLLILLLGIM